MRNIYNHSDHATFSNNASFSLFNPLTNDSSATFTNSGTFGSGPLKTSGFSLSPVLIYSGGNEI